MGTNVKSGRYYWLKLPRDFFDRADIRVLGAGSKGKTYLYIYLRLLCESIETDGYVHIRSGVAYTEHQLARWLGVQDSTMREALRALMGCHLVHLTPYGGLFLSELAAMVGSRTVHADAVRQLRTTGQSSKQSTSREASSKLKSSSTDGDVTVKSSSTDGDVTVKSSSTDGEVTVKSSSTDGDVTVKPSSTNGDATVDRQVQKSLTQQGGKDNNVTKCDAYIEIEKEQEKEIEKEIEIDTEQEQEAEAEADAVGDACGGRAECFVDEMPAAPSVGGSGCVADHPPTLQEVRHFFTEEGLRLSADGFYTYYADRGWSMRDGERMLSWRSVAVWHDREGHRGMFERAARSELCRHTGDTVSKYERWVRESEERRRQFCESGSGV